MTQKTADQNKNSRRKGKKNAFKMNIIETLSKCQDFGDPEKTYENLTTIKKKVLDSKDKKKCLSIIDALANEDRFVIFDTLREKDRCVCELEAILQKSQASVSHHLKILQNAKLIHGWKKGKFTHYSIITSTVEFFRDYLRNWLTEIENIVNIEHLL